jgi:hypothetical protein
VTREQIDALKVGDVLERTLSTRDGKALPDARYGFRGAVTEITARGTSVKGRRYVCFYTQFGENSTMSGSVAEGDEGVRYAPH